MAVTAATVAEDRLWVGSEGGGEYLHYNLTSSYRKGLWSVLFRGADSRTVETTSEPSLCPLLLLNHPIPFSFPSSLFSSFALVSSAFHFLIHLSLLLSVSSHLPHLMFRRCFLFLPSLPGYNSKSQLFVFFVHLFTCTLNSLLSLYVAWSGQSRSSIGFKVFESNEFERKYLPWESVRTADILVIIILCSNVAEMGLQIPSESK